MMVGRNVEFACRQGARQARASVVLAVEGMTVASKLHKNNAVKNVSFTVRAGEIVCIAGIDGNGQTELDLRPDRPGARWSPARSRSAARTSPTPPSASAVAAWA